MFIPNMKTLAHVISFRCLQDIASDIYNINNLYSLILSMVLGICLILLYGAVYYSVRVHREIDQSFGDKETNNNSSQAKNRGIR